MTVTNIADWKHKLEDRAQFCKDILTEKEVMDPELLRACKVYLQYQNDNAWKMVESAHEKWRKM